MEHQKKMNLLNETSDSRFVTKKWSIVSVQTNTNYDAGNEIFYNTEVLKSNLCDNIDAYILARGDITNAGDNGVEIAFKNCSKFIKCIAKNDGTTTDDAEDLNLVMPMYNMLENSSNYLYETVYGFIKKVEANNFNTDIGSNVAFKVFICKTKLVEKTETQRTPDNNDGVLKKQQLLYH